MKRSKDSRARADGRSRVAIEGVAPEIDAGRFPAKAIVGDRLTVEADAFADGHDAVTCVLLHRPPDGDEWSEIAMDAVGNDRWRGALPLDRLGRHRYTIEAWTDPFRTWRRDMRKWISAGKDVGVHLEIGARLVEDAAGRARAAGERDDAQRLAEWSRALRQGARADDAGGALDAELAALAERWPDRERATRYDRELEVEVDRERARFSAWYEMFPRSARGDGRRGGLADVVERLPYVAGMGFDVLYLPPIHPIGETHRKGPDNAVQAGPDDPGSPWAIGGPEGGHTALHPGLGTLDDFRRLVEASADHGLEVALDIAFQCSPDHPWVAEHPEWFRHRPDGTIQHAENPPKKYEDIYPLDFETDDWPALWDALKGVFDFWLGQGVRMFRVDNPHTKPFAFWEWVIAEIKAEHPDAIFLAEAFTRPRVMYRLAKLGFSQSYTYFAWRNTAWELREYMTELTRSPVKDFFRPNFWPNTPDILTEHLQTGGRPAFVARLVLAATLSSNYGIYGPAFELGEHEPREPGSEEYRASEKYEVRNWDLQREDSLQDVITRLNRLRQACPALQQTVDVTFHRVDNDRLLVYSKRGAAGDDVVLIVVNVDPHHTQAGWVDLDVGALGVGADEAYQVHDALGGGRFLWHGARNFVELVPHVLPAHVFRVRRRARTEKDFDYYL